MTMREKIARAICERFGAKWNDVDNDVWFRDADAVLAALREPTPEMLNAARDWSIKKYGQGVGDDGATGCWQAMIDTAKGEDK